jgi:hypothetical protein
MLTGGRPTRATRRRSRPTLRAPSRGSTTRPGTLKLVAVNGAARRPRSTPTIRGRRSGCAVKATITRSPGRSPSAGNTTEGPSRSSADSPDT